MLWGWLDASLLRGTLGFFVGVCLAAWLPPQGQKPSLLWDAVGILSGAALLVFFARFELQSVPGRTSPWW
jgi:hypothetical protein